MNRNRKRKTGLITILFVLIMLAWYFIAKINSIHGDAFVLINGYDGQIYKICLKLFIALDIITMMVILKSNKKLIIAINIVLILFIWYQVTQLINGLDSFHREPYIASPDNKYELYQDGGDLDMLGNSSGYMHYAMKCSKYGYSRIFYCYEEEDTPKIKWYEDGFLVYTNKEESGIGLEYEWGNGDFRYEKRDNGVFFYYMDN